MTVCNGLPAEQCLEQYLQGTLPELEARSFEEHYFDCPVCLAQVEAMQTVTAQLARSQAAVPRMAIVPRRRSSWLALSAVGAVAALLLVVFLVVPANRAHPVTGAIGLPAPAPATVSPPAPSTSTAAASASVAVLADLALPPFQAANLRGDGGDANFSAGMKAYSADDCTGAIKALSMVPPRSDDVLAAEFYSGICQVHERDLVAASASLHKVEAGGDSPQQEAAFYYLAQLALVREDPTTARRYLARTIALHGDFEKRARAQLEKLR